MISIPQLNDPDSIKLIKLVNSNSKPIIVDVKSEKYSIENECFPNVEEKIKRDGGELVIGWQIWKTKIIIEAEFHAVWKSQNGNLIDITPKQIPMTPEIMIPISIITFVPDLQKKYEKHQVDNIRLNITNNLIVDDFIGLAKAEFNFLNEGNKKFQHEIILNKNEQDKYSIIKICKDHLELMAFCDKNRKSDCFCGSGNSYEDCCYQIVNKIID